MISNSEIEGTLKLNKEEDSNQENKQEVKGIQTEMKWIFSDERRNGNPRNWEKYTKPKLNHIAKSNLTWNAIRSKSNCNREP